MIVPISSLCFFPPIMLPFYFCAIFCVVVVLVVPG